EQLQAVTRCHRGDIECRVVDRGGQGSCDLGRARSRYQRHCDRIAADIAIGIEFKAELEITVEHGDALAIELPKGRLQADLSRDSRLNFEVCRRTVCAEQGGDAPV